MANSSPVVVGGRLSTNTFPYRICSHSCCKMATMDVEQLHVVLQQSFSPDIHLRGPAEETIRNLKQIKGATALLLQISSEKQVSVSKRLLNEV